MKKVALFILLSLHLFAITNNVNNKKDKLLFIKTVKLADQGYTKKALKQVNLLLQINPKNPEYLLLKGNILKDLKQYEEAKIALKKVLDKEPNNIKARKLLEDIKKLENISENDVIKNALNWLGDKGIDLLFMFLGVLGGELLISAFSKCNKEQKKEIRLFVNSILNKLSIKDNIGCYFINFLIQITLALVFTIIIALIILLKEPRIFHLDTITKDEFWSLIKSIYLILFIIISAIFFYKTKRTKISTEDVSLILMKFYENKEYVKLKEELLEISRLPKEYVDSIFENIVFEDVREQIKLFYEFIKKGNK